MKMKAFAPFFALFLLCIAAPAVTKAQSASGNYKFTLDDGAAKYVEFDAKGQADGSATGSLFMTDEATVIYSDVDGTGEDSTKYPGFSLTAAVDGLVIDKNQAVVSAVVRDSSVRELIGQRMLLTVEDNGDNTRVPDRLTWGFYKPIQITWTPSDSELKEDPGVGLRWWATDYERKDDVGYAMPRDTTTVDAKTFPVASYAFADIASGAGDILVRP
ncbi:MAG: hypothetical protein ICV60_15620 [Pyrinomonadaceae bacterium]|nr:hypothetical protein [Pyrinomonadaceae bacterium]